MFSFFFLLLQASFCCCFNNASYIYSSKDAVIRVWDRKTLGLHRTLRGHEGPVNAIGLQSGRVVRTINWLWFKIL